MLYTMCVYRFSTVNRYIQKLCNCSLYNCKLKPIFHQFTKSSRRFGLGRLVTHTELLSCLELHLSSEGKAIFILQRAHLFENPKVYGKLLKGHQGQDQGQQFALVYSQVCTPKPKVPLTELTPLAVATSLSLL